MCKDKERYSLASLNTYRNKRSSLNKLSDDRIRNVWNSGVLIEDQTDTTNPEAEERITHHHLCMLIFATFKTKIQHMFFSARYMHQMLKLIDAHNIPYRFYAFLRYICLKDSNT